jgi:hypothetical protein
MGNGPVTSEWGAKRVGAGHPDLLILNMWGGERDKMTPEFEERFYPNL